MLLTKLDYENILRMLDTVEIKGKDAAKAVSVIAHKLEHRVANWFEGDPTGFQPTAIASIPEPPYGDGS